MGQARTNETPLGRTGPPPASMTQAPDGKLGSCAEELHTQALDSEQLKERACGTPGVSGLGLRAPAPQDSLPGTDTVASLPARPRAFSPAAILT